MNIKKIWIAFGDLIHKLISPLVFGVSYFILITPISLIFKLLSKDPLKLKLKHDSLWKKNESLYDKKYFDNQF
jgi:hypothetical protein